MLALGVTVIVEAVARKPPDDGIVTAPSTKSSMNHYSQQKGDRLFVVVLLDVTNLL